MRNMTFFKIIIIPVVTIIFSFVLAELYLKSHAPNNLLEFESASINRPDSELGVSGIPDSQGVMAMKENGQYVFNTTIHLNHWGFRFPNFLKTQIKSESCVLIFGDSMAFGFGVQDDETASAVLQKALKNSRVFNFGFQSYGPNHALRLIEIGREKEFLKGCRRVKSYYFSQMHHVKRASGSWPVTLTAPKYSLVNKILTYQGSFYPEWFDLFHRNYISKWKTLDSIFNFYLGVNASYSDKEIELYKSIIKKMQALLSERYHSPLVIVMFDFGALPSIFATKQLEIKGVPTIYFDELAAKKVGLKNVRQELYIKNNSHLNKFGHKILTEILLSGDLKGFG